MDTPHATASEKHDAFELLVVVEVVERPKAAVLSKWIRVQIRVIAVKKSAFHP